MFFLCFFCIFVLQLVFNCLQYRQLDDEFLLFIRTTMSKIILSNVDGHVNQYDLTIDNVCYFYSYKSLIAELDKDKKTLKIYTSRDYSKTTRKHFYSRCQDNWLVDLVDKKSVLNAIDKGLTTYGYSQVKVNV